MINIGKLGFDLGINMSGFVQSLAQAGASVSSFATKNTQSFAGARQQFTQLNGQLQASKNALVNQQQAMAQAVQDGQRLTAVVGSVTNAFSAQAKTTQQARDTLLQYQRDAATFQANRANFVAAAETRNTLKGMAGPAARKAAA